MVLMHVVPGPRDGSMGERGAGTVGPQSGAAAAAEMT